MRSFRISTAEQKTKPLEGQAVPRPTGLHSFFPWVRDHKAILVAFCAVLFVTGGIELWMGRSPLGPDGRFGLWESSIWSNECSQRLADPYSFSHVTHGILLCGFLWLVARKLPLQYRFMAALFLEAGWELLES